MNKLSNSGQEVGEIQAWLEFSLAYHYIGKVTYEKPFNEYEEIFAMLHDLAEKADTFCSAN